MKIRQDAPVTYAARAQPNGAPPPNESYPPFAYNYPYGQPPLLVPLNYPSPSSSAPVVSTASVISGRSGSEIHRLTLHAQRPCPELDIVLGFLLGFCSLLCSFLLFLAFLRWLFRKAGLHKLTAGKVAEKLTGSWDKGKKEKVQVTPPDSYSPSNSKQNGLEDAEYQQGTTSPTDAPPSNYNPLAGYEHHNPITARTASLYNRLVNKLNTTVEMMSGLKTSAKSNSPRRHHETQQKERDKFRDVTGGRFVPDGEWESTARGVAVSNVKGGRPVRKTGHQKHHRSLRTTPSSPVTVQLFGGHQTPLNFNICYGDNHERFTKTVDVYASTGTLEREDESHTKVNRYRIGETIKKEAGSETVTPWAPSDNESPSASTAATENVHRFKSGPFVSELKESVVQAAQTQYPTGNNAAVQTEVIPVFVRETLTEANTSVYRGADIQWKDQSPSPPINETETDWDERLAHFKAMNRDFKIRSPVVPSSIAPSSVDDWLYPFPSPTTRRSRSSPTRLHRELGSPNISWREQTHANRQQRLSESQDRTRERHVSISETVNALSDIITILRDFAEYKKMKRTTGSKKGTPGKATVSSVPVPPSTFLTIQKEPNAERNTALTTNPELSKLRPMPSYETEMTQYTLN